MKKSTALLLLVCVAALNSACAEENDAPKHATAPASGVSPETLVVAQSAARSAAPAARETGATRTAVDLFATPYRDAKSAGHLSANTPVDILERRGGWLKVSAQGKTGWARLHQIRTGGGPQAKSAGGGLAVLKNVGETGRSGTQGIVATTGIRGLSAEELKQAKPDPAAVKKIEGYRATAKQARDYASAAGLKERKVAPLPKPE